MKTKLYLISPAAVREEFEAALARALDSVEIACFRLEIAGDETEIRRAADLVAPLCAARDVPVLITDHVRLVRDHGLHGAHLSNPAPHAVKAARKELGPRLSLGAWAGASRHRGMSAAEAGADYISLGPVASGALGDGREADDALFDWWEEMIETPAVAEGGMSHARAAELAGRVDFIALRNSVWSARGGAEAALKAYARALG